MRRAPHSFAVLSSIATIFLAGAASGEVADRAIQNQSDTRAAPDEVLENLKPLSNKLPPPDTSNISAETAAQGPALVPGFVPGSLPAAKQGLSPKAFGDFGLPYTSTRVALGGSNQTSAVGGSYLSSTYPYRTIGKLTFSAGYCSATLIRKSVIVTAAHCIQSFGSGSNIYSNFVFRPGHYGPTGASLAQTQPYGSWSWKALVRPATWASGTDIGSGSARDNDLAVIVLAKNSRNQFIGDLVGNLGYGWNNYSFTSSPKTGNLRVAAISTLGYPALMDGGKIQQRADGPSYLTTVGGAGQIWQGNNFTGGSSGGPWVVNFVSANPVLSGGAVIGTAPNTAVVGVTSWGSADPNAIKDNYSSQFRQNQRYPNASYGIYGAGNIGSLLRTLCTSSAGNGQTYAQAGYCS